MSRRRNRADAPELSETLEKPKSFMSWVKDTVNVPKVKKVVRLGADIFTAAMPFIEEPGYWTAAKSVFAAGKVLVEDMEFWSDDYFIGDEWSLPYTRDFNGIILKVVSQFPYETMKSSDESSLIRIVDMNGIKAGYVYKTKLNTVDNVYVETEKLEEGKTLIKKMLWDQYKDANLVMRQNKARPGSEDEGRIVLEPDDAFTSMKSKRASEYSTYLKKCIDAGVSRSVMLYGPPGTGKSTMARTIIDTLNMRSFRIRVEDVASLESSTLFEAITIFEPDAIILDDFDRAHAQAQLLETLEFFQRHVKLVIATVNDRNLLDEAIMRPGRFDELVFVKQMDDDVVRTVLGPEHCDAFDVVKEWPVAFIQEYVKRRKFMSPEEAAASTEELALRVKRLEKYNDVDDVEKMARLMNKTKTTKSTTVGAVPDNFYEDGPITEDELDDDKDDTDPLP
jgi:hypothetical protein